MVLTVPTELEVGSAKILQEDLGKEIIMAGWVRHVDMFSGNAEPLNQHAIPGHCLAGS